MRIEQLEYIVKIAQCGSINKAAQDLYLSQSNLSQSIKSLENEVGKKIFKRTSKGVELTKFGLEFINHAHATMDQYYLTQEFCKTYDRNPPLKFSVACQYMRFANLLFLEIYKKYSSNYAAFSFLEGSFLDIIDNVTSHSAELGILLVSQSQKKITLNLMRSRGLMYNSILACPASITVGKNHPLYFSNLTEVTLEMMKNYPIVMYKDMDFNFSSELSKLDIYTKGNRIIVSDRNTLHEILNSTDSYSIAAYTNAYKNVDYYDNIKALKLNDPRFSMELGWIRSISHPLSDLAVEYIEMIKQSQI